MGMLTLESLVHPMSNFQSLTMTSTSAAESIRHHVLATCKSLGIKGTHILMREAEAGVEVLVSAQLAAVLR